MRRYSDDVLEALAANHPVGLLELIASRDIDPEDLTFAAEIAGSIDQPALVIVTLLPLLGHTVPLVREGAIYGLANHIGNPTVRIALMGLAENDPSPGVRLVAAESLVVE